MRRKWIFQWWQRHCLLFTSFHFNQHSPRLTSNTNKSLHDSKITFLQISSTKTTQSSSYFHNYTLAIASHLTPWSTAITHLPQNVYSTPHNLHMPAHQTSLPWTLPLPIPTNMHHTLHNTTNLRSASVPHMPTHTRFQVAFPNPIIILQPRTREEEKIRWREDDLGWEI